MSTYRAIPTLAMLATIVIATTSLYPKRDTFLQRSVRQPQLAARSLAILLSQTAKVAFFVVTILEVDGAACSLAASGGRRWSPSRRSPRGRCRWIRRRTERRGVGSRSLVASSFQTTSISGRINLSAFITTTAALPIIGTILPLGQTGWWTAHNG